MSGTRAKAIRQEARNAYDELPPQVAANTTLRQVYRSLKAFYHRAR